MELVKDIILNVARSFLEDGSDTEISSISIERFLQKDHPLAGVGDPQHHKRHTAYSMTENQYKTI